MTPEDISTSWMWNNIGVCPGCVISPSLFNIYIEELLARIRMSVKIVEVGDRRLGYLAHADDMVLMTERRQDMVELLQVASTYGQVWGVKFSDRKCKVMEFNSEAQGQWILGNSVLEVLDRYTYLDLEITKKELEVKNR